MPWDKVMTKWKKGTLHSGSKKGPEVTSRAQAIAIMLSEKRAAAHGKSEYAASGMDEHKRKQMRKKLHVESNK